MSWLFRPDQWPRSPQQWFERASRWPVTPRQWIDLADELSRSPTRILVDLVGSVGASFAGREVEIRARSGRTTLEVTAVRCSHDNPPRAMGALRPGLDLEGIQLVEIEAEHVRWGHGAIDHIVVSAHNVRMDPGIIASLVAGPVELRGLVGQETLDEWNELADSELERVELIGPGMVRAWLRPWLCADVRIELDGDHVRFPVDTVRVRGVIVPFAARALKVRSAPVPSLPRDLALQTVEASAEALTVTAVIDRYEEPVMVDRVIRAASTVGSRVVLSLRPEDAPDGA